MSPVNRRMSVSRRQGSFLDEMLFFISWKEYVLTFPAFSSIISISTALCTRDCSSSLIIAFMIEFTQLPASGRLYPGRCAGCDLALSFFSICFLMALSVMPMWSARSAIVIAGSFCMSSMIFWELFWVLFWEVLGLFPLTPHHQALCGERWR